MIYTYLATYRNNRTQRIQATKIDIGQDEYVFYDAIGAVVQIIPKSSIIFISRPLVEPKPKRTRTNAKNTDPSPELEASQ